jgi:HAD superfamily hydrolase (TIGR01509 family)
MVVMFDLGGVLVENHGRAKLTAMLPSHLGHDEIWRKWLGSPSVRSFERGMISPEQFASAFVDEWQIELEPSEFLQSFASWPKGLYDGAEELLQHLKDRHHLACLSNTNAIHWRRFPQLHALFDSCFLSHEIGHVKPDRGAFEYALEHLDARAEDVYFFDDLLMNVNAAREVGMKAFHVESFSAIEPVLRVENLYV